MTTQNYEVLTTCGIWCPISAMQAAAYRLDGATVRLADDTLYTAQAAAREAVPQSKPVRDVPAGEYIKRTATAKRVYIRGDYIRSMRAYECSAADDINACVYIKADKPVFYGFTY